MILWAALSYFTYSRWIHGADHRDFYPRWTGARILLFKGGGLYQRETTQQIQLSLYGHELPSDRDQQGFAYPATLVVQLLPFWFIPNVAIATAIWEGLSLILNTWTLSSLLRLAGVSRWPAVLLVAWYYPFLIVFQGQFTAIPLAAVSLALVAYEARQDVLAGLLGTGATLGLTSLAVAGWWIPGWISQLRNYAEYAQVSWPVETAWRLSPTLTIGLALILTIALS